MRIQNRFVPLLAAVGLLLAGASTGLAGNKKGDRFLAQGRDAEVRNDFDKALGFYEQALAEDPADVAYQMATKRMRFQAAQTHVNQGQKLRTEGQLEEALAEFERAHAIDPSSAIAGQELRRTLDLVEGERKRKEQPGAKEGERGTGSLEEARREIEERLAAVQSVPELKPLSRSPITLKMNNQPPKVLFETVGKLAGINVLF